MWNPRRLGRWILFDRWWFLLPAAALFGVFVEVPSPFLPLMIGVWVALVALGVAAIPIILRDLLRRVRRALLRDWLLRHGVPVSARVTAAQRWGHPMPTIDDIVLVELQLETLSDSQPRTLAVREWIDTEWAPELGEQVWLLVDPRFPDRCRLAPLDWYPRLALPIEGGPAASGPVGTT